jgi:hypothetical protein
MTSREAFEAWYVEGAAVKGFGSRDCALQWDAWQARDAEIAALRAALVELVALKDLKDEELRLRQRRPVREIAQCDAMQEVYRRRKPLAWAAARAAIDEQRKL